MDNTPKADAPPLSSDDADDERLTLILQKLRANPVLAHAIVFARRHPQATPDFHKQIITDFWSASEYVGEMAFRGAAKSTLSEEALCLMALFGDYRYALIAGNSHPRACERLAAIKHEIATNDVILDIFGNQIGDTWNEDEIILKNGVKIQALGARQSFRGAKHWDTRPDMLFIDDLEDEENVDTEAQRDKLARWVSRSLIPACEPGARKRIAGTPLHPKAWLERMRREAGWVFRVHPIVIPAVTDPSQWEHSQWPERFPLERIKQIRDEAERIGELQGFVQEYLCQSEEPALKPFQQRHIIPAPHIPEWAPTILICDPARTVNVRKSARTGYVAASWVGPKLYVRYAAGAYHMPSEIITELFRLDDIFKPIHIGVEKDGLEQFLMQPLRTEMLNRATTLPIWPLMAPRDRNKIAFIKGLQPFFEAGDILQCAEFPDLVSEILGFPTGLVDVLNSLAYAVKMRGGRPVYEDFGFSHVVPELAPRANSSPLWLVVNTSPTGGSHTAAALVQSINGAFRVFADWVREGTADDALASIISDAIQAARGVTFKIAAPADQFDQYNNFGLGRALKRLNVKDPAHTPQPDKCLGALKPLLRGQAMMQQAFLTARAARWTINALAQGYAYGLDKSAMLNPHPEPGYYATLMRGLESFARWVSVGTQNDTDEANWQYTADGRRYISSRVVGNGRATSEFKRPDYTEPGQYRLPTR